MENIAQRYANQCEPYGYEYDTHMFMEASTSVVSAVFFGEPDPECLDENAVKDRDGYRWYSINNSLFGLL